MKGKRLPQAAVLLAVQSAACGSDVQPPTPSALVGALGGGVIARVGTEALPESLVAETATRQHLSAREAVFALIDDSLLAAGARERGLAGEPSVVAQLDASAARRVVRHAREAAIAGGPATDDEVEELTRLHWRELDLPDAMLVIHAVVLRPKRATSDQEAEGRAIASAIAAAETSATDATEFEAKAKAIPHGSFEVRVQKLDPFVADGRVVTNGDTYDPDFAAASAALSPGTTSAVVTSTSGWHVIRLLERLPGKRVPLEERRAELSEEARTRRAERETKNLLSRLRAGTRVDVSNGVDELLTLAFSKGSPPEPDTAP